jgi:hypothetical protein
MAGWSAIFGQSEAMLRLLPRAGRRGRNPADVVVGAAAVAGGAGATGLWAAALVAFSPALVLYSQEARMYTLVVALALLSLIALHALTMQSALHATILGFVGVNWLMTGFHYYSILLVGVAALFLSILALRRRAWGDGARWLAAVVLSLTPVVLWMALAPGFHDTLRVVTANLGGAEMGISAWEFLGSLWRDLAFGAIRWQPEVAVVGLVLAPLVVIGLAATVIPEVRKFRHERDFTPWSWLVAMGRCCRWRSA